MRILVNGDWRDTAAELLSGVLEELGYGQSVVTTAVNGEFVATSVRPCTKLAEGDRIEVLAPMQGG
jgi:sulfur carrier protein